MGRILRKVAHVTLGKAWGRQFRAFAVLSDKHGHIATIRDWNCVDVEGRVIPWYTYPAIEYLGGIDLSGLKVLEYGSGNSSLYYLRRGARVTAIEGNAEWYDKIGAEAGDNDDFSYVLEADRDRYVERSEADGADLVVIDGVHRPACADFIAARIAGGQAAPAAIVLDNADWYPNTVARLDAAPGWPRVDFCGFGPINVYCWTTSIYLNPARQLPRTGAALAPVGGIRQSAADD